MCDFRTQLAIEVTTNQLSLVSQVISNLKKELSELLKYRCSLEEHIFVCGSGRTLVKVLPYAPASSTEVVSTGQRGILSIVIESDSADKLVELNDFFGKSLRTAGIKYRRIE